MSGTRFRERVDCPGDALQLATHQRLPGKVEIVRGLTPDMQIITAGQMRLRDGSTVSVKNSQPPVQTSALPATVSP